MKTRVLKTLTMLGGIMSFLVTHSCGTPAQPLLDCLSKPELCSVDETEEGSQLDQNSVEYDSLIDSNHRQTDNVLSD
ncbi:MAG: hypothetical protein HKN31_08320 [Pricia sp.]|nr:hypothetical protein [Pricia sp.]